MEYITMTGINMPAQEHHRFTASPSQTDPPAASFSFRCLVPGLCACSFACALANKLRPAPVTPEHDKKEATMSFTIWRWHMGECIKMCIALVSVGLLLGCAAPLQETQQIRCTDGDGEILYTGPYNEKSWDGYLVQVDESTR